MRALTDEQERAVSRRGEPLLLAAGAGSGKTSVLVERFVAAVREDGVAPGRILAITFTDRAAGELRQRVRARFLELGDREAARDTEAAFVSTFHGFCTRLLRAQPLAAGLDPDFSILDEHLARRLRARAFDLALGEFVAGEHPAAVELVAAYGADRLRAMLDGVFAELRSRGERRPRLPAVPRQPPAPAVGEGDAEDAGSAHVAQACALLDQLLDSYGRRYEALKRERAAADFDDLELLARELLQTREGVRRAWSERFELLMVDEFQDTNQRQLEILAALERENLFTVGDELQSIYSFRHADVRLFRARRREMAERGASLLLARNFRSRPALLDAVNAVFAPRFGPGYTPLAPAREDVGEPFRSDRRVGRAAPLVELLLTNRSTSQDRGAPPAGRGEAPLWRRAEARLLAERVAELISSAEARAGEVVVLLRALGDVEVYERALQEQGLATIAAAGGFWASQQVGDLICYLRALANPLDELALYGTLASPLVGVSSDALALLARAARGPGGGRVWDTVRGADQQLIDRLPAGDGQALAAFRERFRSERLSAARHTISQLLERAIVASGYREHVLALDWGERRLANVHKLLRLARRFEASEGRDLRGFLDMADQLGENGNGAEPDAPVAGAEPDAVRLMSIHAAKGLEFPVVCVADLGRAPNVSVPDLIVNGTHMGLRLARLHGGEATPMLEFERLCEERRQAQTEEEDRVLYVAMTRARERLLLSGAIDFEQWGERRSRVPAINWLGPALAGELSAQTLAGLLAEGERVLDLPLAASRAAVRCRLNAPAASDAPAAGATTETLGPGRRADAGTGAVPDGQPQKLSQRGTQTDLSPLAELSTLSYTTLSELERCGYRYYLERTLGLAERHAERRAGSAPRGVDARARGTLVHALLEAYDFARPATPGREEVARVARALGLRLSRDELERIAALVGALSESARGGIGGTQPSPAVRVAAAVSVRREHPFTFATGPEEELITGVIDLLARESNGNCLVLDYKTDRVRADEDLVLLVERDYGLQRLLYALAVLRDGAPAVEIVHWFLERPHDWVSARYAVADRSALEQELAARIARARAGALRVSDRPHRGLCETCPGRGALCSWSDAETLREQPLQTVPE